MKQRPFANLALWVFIALANTAISFGIYAYLRMRPILMECELNAASSAGETGRVEQLLNAGVNPSETYQDLGLWGLAEAYAEHRLHDVQRYPPLTCAIEDGHPDVAKVLIAHGADVNDAGNHWNCGMTPLMAVAGTNDIDLARVLIEHGADVNAKYKDGSPVLANCESPGIAALLKAAGAKPE